MLNRVFPALGASIITFLGLFGLIFAIAVASSASHVHDADARRLEANLHPNNRDVIERVLQGMGLDGLEPRMDGGSRSTDDDALP